MAIAELPSWLAVEQRYEPVGARHRVMQKNVLHLASLLERVRLGGGAHEGGSMVDRALSCVSAPVRLVGMFVCVLCVCLTQSPLYLMLMAAIALVLVAVRPARDFCTGAWRHGACGGSGAACPVAERVCHGRHAQDCAQDVY